MHITILYQHYNNPDCPSTARFHSFLYSWTARHSITLITSRAHLGKRLSHQFDWVPSDVRLKLLNVGYENEMGVRERFVSYVRFAAQAASISLRTMRPDVLVGISTPLTTALATAAVARLHGVPWVFVVKDLWPDFPIQMGAVPQPWLQRLLYRLEHWLYHSAAHVIPFSPDMAAHVLAHGVAPEHVTMQYNGTDFNLLDACTVETLQTIRSTYGLAGKQVVLYGGTYGRANAIPTLLQAAERLTHRTDVQFVCIGSGYFDATVEAATARLPNLTSVPAQPRHRMLCWYRLADISLVPFLNLPVLATNSPAKFYDSLGAGTPVIVTNPGWTKDFVETHRCGWYVPPEDPVALAQRLDTLLKDPNALAEAGRCGATIARRLFDRTVLAAEMEAILERVAAAGK